jgi:hypothetical protein
LSGRSADGTGWLQTEQDLLQLPDGGGWSASARVCSLASLDIAWSASRRLLLADGVRTDEHAKRGRSTRTSVSALNPER